MGSAAVQPVAATRMPVGSNGPVCGKSVGVLEHAPLPSTLSHMQQHRPCLRGRAAYIWCPACVKLWHGCARSTQHPGQKDQLPCIPSHSQLPRICMWGVHRAKTAVRHATAFSSAATGGCGVGAHSTSPIHHPRDRGHREACSNAHMGPQCQAGPLHQLCQPAGHVCGQHSVWHLALPGTRPPRQRWCVQMG